MEKETPLSIERQARINALNETVEAQQNLINDMNTLLDGYRQLIKYHHDNCGGCDVYAKNCLTLQKILMP